MFYLVLIWVECSTDTTLTVLFLEPEFFVECEQSLGIFFYFDFQFHRVDVWGHFPHEVLHERGADAVLCRKRADMHDLGDADVCSVSTRGRVSPGDHSQSRSAARAMSKPAYADCELGVWLAIQEDGVGVVGVVQGFVWRVGGVVEGALLGPALIGVSHGLSESFLRVAGGVPGMVPPVQRE